MCRYLNRTPRSISLQVKERTFLTSTPVSQLSHPSLFALSVRLLDFGLHPQGSFCLYALTVSGPMANGITDSWTCSRTPRTLFSTQYDHCVSFSTRSCSHWMITTATFFSSPSLSFSSPGSACRARSSPALASSSERYPLVCSETPLTKPPLVEVHEHASHQHVRLPLQQRHLHDHHSFRDHADGASCLRILTH